MRPFTICILLILALTDCTKSRESQADEKVTLTVWIMPNNPTPVQDFTTLIQPFINKNPHITVQVELITWDAAWPKLSEAAVTGSGPDIAQIGTTYVPGLAQKNAFLDLSGKIDMSTFNPGTLESTQLRNTSEIVAVPWFIDTRIIFYRKDACQKAGVDPETDFRDWESFKASLQKLKGITINGTELVPLSMPGKNDWNVVHFYAPWIWSAGGSFISDDLQSSAINSPQSKEAVYFYSELLVDGLMSKEAIQKNTHEVFSFFTSGKSSVMIAMPEILPLIEESQYKDQISACLLPAGPNGRAAFFGGSNLAVYKSSQHPEEALKLVQFLTSDTAQITYSKMIYFLPASRSAIADNYFVSDPVLSVFKEQLRYGRQYPAIPVWGILEEIYTEGLSRIWDNASEVNGVYSRQKTSQILDNLAEEVTAVIRYNAE